MTLYDYNITHSNTCQQKSLTLCDFRDNIIPGGDKYMKERIKMIRKELNLNQEEFAQKVGLSKNYISLVENGNRNLADRTISDICRIFSINEDWLREGIEPMRVPVEDEEAAYVSELIEDLDNPLYDLIKAIMKTYCESGEKEKVVLKSFAKDLKNNLKKES